MDTTFKIGFRQYASLKKQKYHQWIGYRSVVVTSLTIQFFFTYAKGQQQQQQQQQQQPKFTRCITYLLLNPLISLCWRLNKHKFKYPNGTGNINTYAWKFVLNFSNVIIRNIMYVYFSCYLRGSKGETFILTI
jgi:hypothetical protein